MANFILVHGAWQGVWSWDRVIGAMEATTGPNDLGRVLAMDLPGHGQRSADEIRRITMGHYVHAAATPAQIERLDDVVLVGHGFAGTFLPQVSSELGGRVRRVVLIAGELPPEGQSAYDRLSLLDKMMLRAFRAGEKGFRLPDFIYRRTLCNGLDEDSARLMLSRLVPEPFQPWRTPVSRQGFAGNLPITYIVLTKDRAIRPQLQRRYVQSLGGPQVEELDAGHGALLSHAQEIARILLSYA